MNLTAVTRRLVADLASMTFGPPVTHVYNPLQYAREPYEQYLETYARRSIEVLLVGMNPGPWGMAQTGVPFGEVAAVKEWLGIGGRVGKPDHEHPKRPVEGFDCSRSEVSGRRLWGWARQRFQAPEAFFKRFFVANYCPLVFIEESGRNRTPDKLPRNEQRPLLEACDRALKDTLNALAPRFAVGIGQFAATRVASVADAKAMVVGRITHPSPANPKANRGWDAAIEEELRSMGVEI